MLVIRVSVPRAIVWRARLPATQCPGPGREGECDVAPPQMLSQQYHSDQRIQTKV